MLIHRLSRPTEIGMLSNNISTPRMRPQQLVHAVTRNLLTSTAGTAESLRG